MKKIFLFLLFGLFVNSIIGQAQNQVIANGISAESFYFATPTDSLNFVSATQKVNGVGIWRKVNLGQIKTWINTDNINSTVVDVLYTVANTGNTGLVGKFVRENGNTFITCFVDRQGNKHTINAKSFTNVGNTGVILPDNDPNSDFKGAFVKEQNKSYITAYVDAYGRRFAIGEDLSLYLKSSEAQTTYATKANLNLTNDNINYGKPFLGEVTMFAGSNIPQNYLMCDGRMLSKTAYSALYSTIAGQFGENTDSFRLPDLSNKFVRGGTNRGQTGGADSVTINANNLPNLSVTGSVAIPVNTTGAFATNSNNPSLGVLATTSSNTYSMSTPNAIYSGRAIPILGEVNGVGANNSISTTPSYIVLSYIIRAL